MESVHNKYGENGVATGTERTKLFCLVNINRKVNCQIIVEAGLLCGTYLCV